jgi:hypothetical protein
MPFSIKIWSTRPSNRLTTSVSAPSLGRTRARTCPACTWSPITTRTSVTSPEVWDTDLAAGVAGEQDSLVATHLDRDAAETNSVMRASPWDR